MKRMLRCIREGGTIATVRKRYHVQRKMARGRRELCCICYNAIFLYLSNRRLSDEEANYRNPALAYYPWVCPADRSFSSPRDHWNDLPGQGMVPGQGGNHLPNILLHQPDNLPECNCQNTQIGKDAYPCQSIRLDISSSQAHFSQGRFPCTADSMGAD